MKRRIQNVIYDLFHVHPIEGLLTLAKAPSLTRIIFRLKYYSYELFHPEHPWLTPKANSLLIRWLSPHMKGFEWGSGRSTIFFSRRVHHLVSIEHDAYWFKRVNSELKQKGIKNVDHRFIPPMKWEETAARAHDCSVAWAEYKYLQRASSVPEFLNYVNAINDYPGEYFDFILVDGKARFACMLNAIPKLKVGGLLILDNSELFRELFQFFGSWKKIHTTDQFTGDTDIWIKPSQTRLESHGKIV